MNDSGSGISDTDFDADMRTILTRARAANPNVAILIVIPNETNNSSQNDRLELYSQKILKIALDFDAAIFDSRWVLGNYTQATSRGYMQDTVHPSSAIGSKVVGNALFEFIGGEELANIDNALLI